MNYIHKNKRKRRTATRTVIAAEKPACIPYQRNVFIINAHSCRGVFILIFDYFIAQPVYNIINTRDE